MKAGFAVQLCSRAVAAVLGGYALASAIAIIAAGALPIPRSEAVLSGTYLGFVVYPAVAVWAFAPQSQRRMWQGLLALTMLLAAVGWLLSKRGL